MRSPSSTLVAAMLCFGSTAWLALGAERFAQEPRETPRAEPLAPLEPLAPTDRWLHGHFATGAVCSMCHAGSERATAMRDGAGRSVAPHDLWSATMMANSSRDPIWRAFVSAEVAAHPEHRARIEAECLRCHAPMAAEQIRLHGGGELSLELLRGGSEEPLTQLALDGASCTTCHQIPPEAVAGPSQSDSGHLQIGHDQVLYGPHAEPATGPMQTHTKFTPTLGAHVMRSALCSVCHTLYTKPHDAPAEQRPFFPEQAPYLEWRNSVYDDERAEKSAEARTCQSCHLPQVDASGTAIETRLAHNPLGSDFPFLEPRKPIGRHLLVGGNTLAPALLRDFSTELNPAGSPAALDRVIAETRAQLRERTASISIDRAVRGAGRLELALRIESAVGHKFPSGIPVRRAWLRVRVRDEMGRVLFASGEHDERGRILGAEGLPLPSEECGGPTEPHRARVAAPSEVALFEALMADSQDRITWRLLEAKSFAKDDRILPRGWDPTHPDAAATAPRGVEISPTFEGGQATVEFDCAVPPGAGALEIEAALLYQPLGARHLSELAAHDTPEVRALLRFLRGRLATEIVAEARLRLP